MGLTGCPLSPRVPMRTWITFTAVLGGFRFAFLGVVRVGAGLAPPAFDAFGPFAPSSLWAGGVKVMVAEIGGDSRRRWYLIYVEINSQNVNVRW